MSKSIKTSTYMQFNEVCADALDSLYYASRNTPDYRACVRMALDDLIRNVAHDVSEEKANKIIDKMQRALIRASMISVMDDEK